MPRLLILTKNVWTILSSYHQPTLSAQRDDQTLYVDMQPGALAEPYQDEHDDTKPTFTESKYQQLLSHKLVSYFSPDSQVYEDNMTQIEDVFRKNAKHAQEHGFILGYIIIPDELQVNDDLSKKSIAALPEATVVDLDLPQKNYRKFFQNPVMFLIYYQYLENKRIKSYCTNQGIRT